MKLIVDSITQTDHAALQSVHADIVRYRITVNGIPYPYSSDVSTDEKHAFRDVLLNKRNKVTTSGLNTAQLLETYRKYPGQKIISFHLSEKLTAATYAALRQVKAEHPEIDLEIIDSAHTSVGYSAQLLRLGREMQQGISLHDLLALAGNLRDHTFQFAAVCDLFFLRRGGRIGLAKALVGTAMGMTPLLSLRGAEGVIKPFGRSRKFKQANERFVAAMAEDVERLESNKLDIVISWFGPHEEEVNHLRSLIEERKWEAKVHVFYGNLLTSVHLGGDYWEVGYTVINDR